MPSIKDFVEAMSTSWPAALAIFIAGASILISDYVGLKYLETLPNWMPGVAFLVTVLSGGILAVALLQSVATLAMRPIWQRRFKAAQRSQIADLENLPEPEALLLAWAVANRTQVFSGPYFNPHIKALIAKGLLTIPPGHHHSDEIPLQIPDHIWTAVKDDTKDEPLLQELVGLKPFDRW